MRKSSLILSVLLIGLICPGSLLSAEAASDLYSLSLQELTQIKITGSTLTAKALKSVPAAVTVFSHKEIKNMGLDSLAEVMKLVPGFQSYRATDSPSNYPYSSRGRNISGLGTEILILVDGMRLADPLTSGGIAFAPKYPLMRIARVEFIRGPGSAVYGSNAMMGVINIITRSEADELSISVGSFGRRTLQLLTSQKIGAATLELLADLDRDNGDDYQVFDSFDTSPDAKPVATQDPHQQAYLSLKLRWKDTQVNLQHNQFKQEDFYATSHVSNEYNEYNSDFTAISLKQAFSWGAIDSWVWLSYTQQSSSGSSQLAAAGTFSGISNPDSSEAWFAQGSVDDARDTRLQWHNDWAINAQSSVQFGLELRRINTPAVLGRSNFDLVDVASGINPIRYYGTGLGSAIFQRSSRRDIDALYGQYQGQLFDNTQLTLGLRQDSYSSIGSNISPRLALVQPLNKHQSLKLLYGEAFRAPTELEQNLVNLTKLLSDPELAPETVHTGELIWLGEWPNTSLQLGYFDSRFKDAIVQEERGDALAYVNRDEDPSKGFEFEWRQQLYEHWLLRGSYTHFTELPASSFREAEQMASVMVNYQRANWDANLIVTYQGARSMHLLDSSGERLGLDSYWLLFAKLQYRFNSQWQTFVQVKNLLGERYRTPANDPTSTLSEGTPNRGRAIQVGMVWQF